jgi:D-alanine--D-alanine ligase
MINKQISTIGILMGGFSSERNISLKSGQAVFDAVKDHFEKVEIFDFDTEQELIDKLKQTKVDCLFNALHGRFGEDGQVQQILDDLGIAYTGSKAKASGLAMDKVKSHEIFKQNGVDVPDYQVFNKQSSYNHGFYTEFPLVVKPALEGSSIGMSIVDEPEALFFALKQALSFNQDVLIEKYVPGREITVGILEGKALPVVEVVPKNKFYDFHAKYTKGMTEYIIPARFEQTVIEQVQQLAVKAHNLLGCDCFSRVDMIMTSGNRPIVLEVNTIPGLTATSLLPKAAKAAGIGFTELCLTMINSAVKDTAGTLKV